MKLFLQKHAKYSSAGGFAPRPPCLRRLGAFPPNPQPPAAGGFAPKPPKQPPHCEFLATRLLVAKTSSFGLRTSFPNEKRRSTAALDGRGVFNFMNTFFKFLQTERAAKMSLFGGSLKYDSTIFATLVFRRFWLSKREPKKPSFGSSTNTSSPLL